MGILVQDGYMTIGGSVSCFFRVFRKLKVSGLLIGAGVSELQMLLCAKQAGSPLESFNSLWVDYGRSSLLAREEFHYCERISLATAERAISETLLSLDFTFIDRLEADGSLTLNEAEIVRHMVRGREDIREMIDHWYPLAIRFLKQEVTLFRDENRDE